MSEPFKTTASVTDKTLRGRQTTARVGSRVMLFSLLFALLALVALLINVINSAFGRVIVRQAASAEQLAGKPADALSRDELEQLLRRTAESGDIDDWTRGVLRRMESEKPLAERNAAELRALLDERVLKTEIVESFTLFDSVFNTAMIERERATLDAARKPNSPALSVQWRSWLSTQLLTTPMNSTPALSGIRNAILGSLAVILTTMLFAIPIGVGAAIYLEEYAGQSRLNQLIQTNINNLAGVPSIIYGMLGLFIFVRTLEPLTSGAVFGLSGGNGRTILSAGLTMALLVLPIIIINAQEAIRAVPGSLRQASYGLGATKWETIRDHVLPSALPGILTGTILAMSRAIGETAPMVVIGASTFIVTDPTGPFSKFTTLPIQIYNLTAQPGEQYRNVAAAAILVLLFTLLSLNLAAILLRNKYARQR
jgi:phosphate transport system permease protein